MDYDVTVVGAGPAGLSAAVFLSRTEFDTLLLEDGESILRRNAHLENYLGFPAGVNSRLLLEMGLDQAERMGCSYRKTGVTGIEEAGDSFRVWTEDGVTESGYVVVASWSDASILDSLDVETEQRGSKTYVVQEEGRTSVEGLYSTGRLAGIPHQTIVAAGHGARTALSLIHDSDVPFYHDWVAPEGYFTDRGREVPPGCEEIGEEERLRRERESIRVMQDYFREPHPGNPVQHPDSSA